MIPACRLTDHGSMAEMSEPRRSQRSRLAFAKDAPDISTLRMEAPSQRAPVRSASRIRTCSNEALCKLAPGSPTKDQSPPRTVRESKVQRLNRLPISWQSMNVAPKEVPPGNAQ